MTKNFYRAFEEKYRGDRQIIKQRLITYLPFVKAIQLQNKSIEALDLGCGRGEWLELLGEIGIKTKGIDLDEGMLEACLERKLTVERQDVFEALSQYADNTVGIISGFHIVEHIPIEKLTFLMLEVYRVLQPGGIIIFETPNPENICVGTNTFYSDPTHTRPIPESLLFFLLEYAGFQTIKTLYLNEEKELHEALSVTLFDVLIGVSPDYAIIAQKKSCFETQQHFLSLMEQPYGLPLHVLAEKFEQRLQCLQNSLEQTSKRCDEYEKVYHSLSWRITKPLRWLKKLFFSL